MKKTLASLAAVAVVSLGTSLAFAQGVAIELAPEVRTTFHEHVTTTNVAPVTVETELVVGGVVPPEITLHPVPPVIIESAPELEAHQYFVVDDRIHVVHPETRAIVTVID
jgi:hypothetical protein